MRTMLRPTKRTVATVTASGLLAGAGLALATGHILPAQACATTGLAAATAARRAD